MDTQCQPQAQSNNKKILWLAVAFNVFVCNK